MLTRNSIVVFVLLGALLIIMGSYLKITHMPASDTVIVTGLVMSVAAIIAAILHGRKTSKP